VTGGVRRVLGIAAIVAGVVAAVALWLGAGRRYDNAVADLAPAPIGCDTTLVFDRTGRYTFFVETRGHVGAIDGDCESAARDYDVARTPRVALTLVDSDGDSVDLDRSSGPSYDRDGRRGDGVRSVQIETTGSYVLTATSANTDAMIRVGRDPGRGVGALRLGAVLALVLGVIVGVLLLALGRPRRPAPVSQPVLPWPTRLPTSPPLAPPNANPPIPPPYAPRPPSDAPPPGTRPPTGPPEPSSRPPGGWPARGGPLPPPRPPTSRPT
jgi:hypothetical protein